MPNNKNYHSDNNSFIVYKDWAELISALDSDEQRGQLMTALFRFAVDGTEPEFTGALKIVFLVMKQALDRDGAKWTETRLARSEAGKKGGRPRTNDDNTEADDEAEDEAKEEKQTKAKKANAFSEKQTKAKKPVNVNVSENVSDNVSVSESDIQGDETSASQGDDTLTDEASHCGADTPTPSQQERKAFDSNGIIEMTQREYINLVHEFGKGEVDSMISRMSDYCLAKGVDYKNYAAALRRWIRSEREKPRPGGSDRSYQRDDGQYGEIMGAML